MNEFLMVLTKPQLTFLNIKVTGLVSQFQQCQLRIFYKVMYIKLKPCIRWPDKDTSEGFAECI